MPGYVGCKHAALACAGAATAEGFSEDSGLYNLNFLHDLPNSHGWVADAATDLHEDLEKLSWAGAATVEDFSEDPGLCYFNSLHGWPSSQGWEADAATVLHDHLLDGVFSLHALGGHGGAASVQGDTGSAVFSQSH